MSALFPSIAAGLITVAGGGALRRALAGPIGAARKAGRPRALITSLLGLRPTRPPSPLSDLAAARAAFGAGASLPGALRALAANGGPWASSMHRVVAEIESGMPIQAALRRWADASREGTVSFFVDSLLLVHRTGGSQARAIDAVIETVRERESLALEVRASSAQAATSGVVLVATPLGFAVVVALVDPRIGAFYLYSPLGWACLVLGTSLDAAGGYWMSRLVRGSTGAR